MTNFSGGDDPILADLLPGYLDRRWSELETLNQALEAGDFAKLMIIGHNLHGSGGAYGLDKISELGQALETAAREKDGDSVRATIQRIRAFLELMSD